MGDGRLALFLPSLRGGGAERVMVTLARGFAERGHEVDLVLVRAEGPFLADVPDAVRVIDLGASRTLASLPALVRYLRRERPAAMLSAMDHANVMALWARRFTGTPERLVISVRTTLSRVRDDNKSIRHRLMPSLARSFYPWADSIVAVSSGVAGDLLRITGLPSRRIKVIYNPVSIAQVRAGAGQPLAHPWFRSGAPPVVLGAGRLVPEKDFETLIRAFVRVRDGREARLVILGEGKERAKLSQLVRSLGVASDVEMPGFVPNPFAYMARSAVFALSSRREGLPNVLLQSIACRTPVVATDCPSGPAEILRNGRWGQLVPVGSIEAFASAIEWTLQAGSPPPSRDALAPFSMDRVTDSYLALLCGLTT